MVLSFGITSLLWSERLGGRAARVRVVIIIKIRRGRVTALTGFETTGNAKIVFRVSVRRPKIPVPDRTGEPHRSARRQTDRARRHYPGVEVAGTQHHKLFRGNFLNYQHALAKRSPRVLRFL